ncbi:hypothetical protein PG994_012205 [Apiospora phragmitis]|uniref:3-beta hydroxysteroid dehydrogenase/isomerase domain-containing protein n=1 Tax=Apiospora phragmitis TaxID=2905665 RepID=A0ABR1TV19_9PEZI
MEWLRTHPLASAAAAALALAVLYFWKLNRALAATPPEVLALSPHRWTKQEIRDTYARLEQSPLRWAAHLPPARPDRRYIVVGGSGGVGGQLVLHLLERGQSPESIRNVDFRAPARPDMRDGLASRVGFVQADITDAPSVEAAFAQPWPSTTTTSGDDDGDAKDSKGLTVFHTAAMIVPTSGARRRGAQGRRLSLHRDLFRIDGGAARGDLTNWFRRWPRHYVQVLDEADFDRPLRPHGEYFGNYARAKAAAERLVCGANSPDFRTGAIRPANGIYGTSVGDQLVGLCLRSEFFPSWTPNIIQNLVHASHVSIGHLLFEAALLDHDDEDGNMPGCAGRPFVITDPNPPPSFRDIYDACETLATTPCQVQALPPAPMLLLAFAIEFCDTLAGQVPSLLGWLRPRGQIAMLQPAIFSVSTHTPATDAAAQRPVAAGGLGYRGVYTTLEGICQQVLDWNREHAAGAEGEESSRHSSNGGIDGKVETLVKDVQNVATMPAAVGA